VGHIFQYPEDTCLIYTNFTPRKSRIPGVKEVVFFGLQAFIKDFLIDQFNRNFFQKPKEEVLTKYKHRIETSLGKGAITYDHIAALHDLQYLPIKIKAIKEGTVIPFGVPALTVVNTNPEFFWLPNFFETVLSSSIWGPCTSATTARRYQQLFIKAAQETVGDVGFVPYQGHDFSMRGMDQLSAAAISGAGHLLSFVGTDTIPAIEFLEQYYNADSTKELIGTSIPATEHSVMCMGTKESEIDTFKRLITQVYPKGFVSIVSDTWDFWKVLTEMLPELKATILNREGKVVIRPDSGDPVKIICGDPNAPKDTPAYKGAVQLLWEIFGGTMTSKGYKLLDQHIGLIYGDSITEERAAAIISGLKEKGFASINVVYGIGSFTYQYRTRDTQGWAMKATYGEICTEWLESMPPKVKEVECREIFKDPITDDGTKKSARGLLLVERVETYEPDSLGDLHFSGHVIRVKDRVSWEEEATGLLEPVFEDGKLLRDQTLHEIRTLLVNQS